MVFAIVVLAGGRAAWAADTTGGVEQEGVGSLTIRSTPSGALTIVDGIPVGETPVKVDSLPAGTHRLQLQMQGYMGKAASVRVSAGADAEVAFTLIRPATLVVLGEPQGAQVSLDTLRVGGLPTVREGLKPGSYQLSVSRPGYVPVDTLLALQEGAVDTVRIALLAEGGEADAAPAAKPVAAAPRGSGRRVATIAAVGAFVVFSVVLLVVDLASD